VTARIRTPASTCSPPSPPRGRSARPGGRAVYSNYGYGLLGYALAHSAGMPYGELVRARITAPLGLAHTALDTPGLVQGHTWRGRPTPPWNLNDLAGAGGLRSTAADLLTYLALHGPDASGPLADAAREARRPRAKLAGTRVGLGWLIVDDLVLHEGGTGGFRTFAATRPDTGDAVVVLANHARSTARLGLQLLDDVQT
jgi:CubicO group peptidase (beta-lactamase class C family)